MYIPPHLTRIARGQTRKRQIKLTVVPSSDENVKQIVVSNEIPQA